MTEQLNNFSDEEKAILESYEAGEWQSVADQENEKTKYQQYARPHSSKISE